MLNIGVVAFKKEMDDYLNSLENSPKSHGWGEALTPNQVSLLQTLRNCSPSLLKTFVSKMKPDRKNPIVLIGPSGVGKTCVALRLAGKRPDRVSATKDKTDRTQFIADMEAINVYSPPGTYKHGNYLDTVVKLMTSKTPPSVVCMVVCSGFHATADGPYLGTLDKPNFNRPDKKKGVLKNLKEFRDFCLNEEIEYLNDLFERIKGKMKSSIPWVITIVNKKDLWWKYKNALNRYTSDNSVYSKTLAKLRGPEGWGAPDRSVTQHIVFPSYLVDDGFGPSPSIPGTSLRQANMEADTLILRGLVFNKYTRGI